MKPTPLDAFRLFLIPNAVPLVSLVLSATAIPISPFSFSYLLQELLVRLSRNSFLVLSLLIPIMAGMGLNFGMVLGAMAGQIGLIFVCDWNIVGVQGMLLAAIIALPLAVRLRAEQGTGPREVRHETPFRPYHPDPAARGHRLLVLRLRQGL